MTSLLAHGVVPASAEIDAGEDGVERVESGAVAALVTAAADGGGRLLRRDLVRHSDVLQAAVAATTVVPLRFGTVFGSREELVEELLRPRHDELLAVLGELEGKVEMSFKASLREDAVLRELVASDPEVAALRDATRGRSEEESYRERVRLGELVAAGLAARRRAYEQRVLDCVAPHVAAVRLPDGAPAPTAIEASLLVARADLPSLETALEELARDAADELEARLLGPLPPYTFVADARPAERVA